MIRHLPTESEDCGSREDIEDPASEDHAVRLRNAGSICVDLFQRAQAGLSGIRKRARPRICGSGSRSVEARNSNSIYFARSISLHRRNRARNRRGVRLSMPNGFSRTSKSLSLEMIVFAPLASAQASTESSSGSRLRCLPTGAGSLTRVALDPFQPRRRVHCRDPFAHTLRDLAVFREERHGDSELKSSPRPQDETLARFARPEDGGDDGVAVRDDVHFGPRRLSAR